MTDRGGDEAPAFLPPRAAAARGPAPPPGGGGPPASGAEDPFDGAAPKCPYPTALCRPFHSATLSRPGEWRFSTRPSPTRPNATRILPVPEFVSQCGCPSKCNLSASPFAAAHCRWGSSNSNDARSNKLPCRDPSGSPFFIKRLCSLCCWSLKDACLNSCSETAGIWGTSVSFDRCCAPIEIVPRPARTRCARDSEERCGCGSCSSSVGGC